MRHGPHHSAHASTSTGFAEDASMTSAANDASVTTCGFESRAAASLNRAPHLPQMGLCAAARNSLTRFFVPQFGQVCIAIAQNSDCLESAYWPTAGGSPPLN